MIWSSQLKKDQPIVVTDICQLSIPGSITKCIMPSASESNRNINPDRNRNPLILPFSKDLRSIAGPNIRDSCVDKPFTAYQGDEPYIFVSYAHEDSEVVYSEIQWLKDPNDHARYIAR